MCRAYVGFIFLVIFACETIYSSGWKDRLNNNFEPIQRVSHVMASIMGDRPLRADNGVAHSKYIVGALLVHIVSHVIFKKWYQCYNLAESPKKIFQNKFLLTDADSEPDAGNFTIQDQVEQVIKKTACFMKGDSGQYILYRCSASIIDQLLLMPDQTNKELIQNTMIGSIEVVLVELVSKFLCAKLSVTKNGTISWMINGGTRFLGTMLLASIYSVICSQKQ
jgi:hypothetical protein